MSERRKAIVVGAGVTGLSAAWKLAESGFDVTVIERSDHVGGLAATMKHGEFLLDHGPHKITTLMTDIMQVIEELIGDELLHVKKHSRIFLQGRFLNYPVRAKDLITGISIPTGIRCLTSYLWATTRNVFRKKTDGSYKDWVDNRFGTAVADLVFNGYARKLWGDPATLSLELAETRIALPNLFEVFVQMVLGIKRKGAVISTDDFRYPKFGAGTLPIRISEKVIQAGGTILLGESVKCVVHDTKKFTEIRTNARTITLGSNDAVVCTIPLGHLVRYAEPPAPQPVVDAVRALKTRNLILVYFIVNKQRVTPDSWIFFPEEKYLFNRLYEQKGFSESMGPKDKTVLCAEITPDAAGPIWNATDDEVAAKCLDQITELGFLTREDVAEHFAVRLTGVYQVYDLNFRANSGTVFNYLDSFSNFYSIGRHGGFNYVGQADCMDMGFRTARYIAETPIRSRAELRSDFDNYAVLD